MVGRIVPVIPIGSFGSMEMDHGSRLARASILLLAICDDIDGRSTDES